MVETILNAGLGPIGMNAELDRTVDWTVRFIGEIPAAVALFDRDLRYVAASKPWIAAFGLYCIPLAGRRHDELCRVGREALAAVQRPALAGDTVEEYHLVDDDPAARQWPAILSARPNRDPDGTVTGIIVGLREDPVSVRDGVLA